MTGSQIKKYQIQENQFQEIVIDVPGEYLVELVGAGAEAEIKGGFIADNDEKKLVTVVIHHKAPHTRANTTLKGVGKDNSFIKLMGRIIIDEDCGDTQSFLTERVLLLNDNAKAETVPDLEIKTDDVKCSHAASITFLPEEQIFYLMSRGISRKEAEGMLVEGFLDY